MIPKKGQYQYRVDKAIRGYADTKEEAVKLAVDACLKDAMFYTYPRPWYVGVVIRVETKRVENGSGWGGYGPAKRTAVITSTVAFGHGIHEDAPITIPSGIAQGRSRS